MSDGLEARLGRMLANRASGIDGVRFTAEEVVHAGRRARTRRRRVGVLVVAGAVVAVVAGTSVAGLERRGQGPVHPPVTTSPPSVTPTPTPSGEPVPSYTPELIPTTGVPAASVRLNYAIGSQISPWDGGTVGVALPAGYRVEDGVRVPGGWVLTAGAVVGDGTPHLWWQPDGSLARDVGPVFGNWEVSSDGRTLVVAGVGDVVTAYRLPTMVELASTTFDGGIGPLVLGVAGDWAVLKLASGDGSPTVAGSWNYRTGQLTRTPAEVDIWGVSNDGRVLRRVAGSPTSCVDLVPVTALADLGRTGLCSAQISEISTRATMSPDGTRVVLTRHEQATVLLHTSDIRSGSWQPVATVPGAGVMVWDTDASYLTRTDAGQLLRCTSATRCTPVALPGLPPDVAIIANRGL